MSIGDAPASPERPGRYLTFTFAVMLFVLLAVSALNLVIDPGSIFQKWKNQSGRLEKTIAGSLNSGTNVATSLYFDVALMKRDQVRSNAAQIDALVLGSSRIMEVRPKMMGGEGAFFNAFVASANLQDILAMYEVCTANRARPSHVLIAIDPWIFNAGYPDITWPSLSSDYASAARRLGLSISASPSTDSAGALMLFAKRAADWLNQAKELVSWGYTSESLKILSLRWREGKPVFKQDYFLTHDDFSDLRVFRSDGSMGFEPAYRDRDEKSVKQGAIQYAAPPVFGLKDFAALDPARCQAFERFLGDLKSHGADVVLYLPPYHPAAYAEFLKDEHSRSLVLAEKYVRDYAKEHGIAVRGSYDAASLGCMEGEFYDATHVRGERVALLLKQGPN